MTREISIPLDIPDVNVLKVETNEAGDVIITVESTQEGTRCGKCGREIGKFHGHDEEIQLRHLSILGRKVYIQIRPKRYQCRDCEGEPTTTQRVAWYDPRSPHTKAYEEHVLLQLVNSTVQDVSIKEGLGYEAIMGIIQRHIETEVDWGKYKKIGVLGLDEIALKKGHKNYVVIVTGRLRDGRVVVLAVLADRKKKTVKAFLKGIPKRLKRTIHTVCTDMYEGYVKAVKEVLGTAMVVVDRFHVAKNYRECADKLRKQEMRRLKEELSEEEYKELKGAMWVFRKKPEELEPEEKEVLERLFEYSPELKQAYQFREELTEIFETDQTKDEATEAIENWKERVQESGLTCFKSFITTLENWIDEITNYFVRRSNSGFVEGLNNKIKVLKRRCYGIQNTTHLFQRLWLDLEGYRLLA